MTRQERIYNRKLKELTDNVGKLDDAAVERVLALLETARAEIEKMIAGTEWQAYRIGQLKEMVDRAIQSFSQQYQADAAVSLRNSWMAGIDAVDMPLASIGIRVLAPELNREALEIMQGYSMDLIRNLSQDAVKMINGEITLGILGEKTPWDVMQAIGTGLEEKGIVKNIARRAETITRTEMARVHSAARQARIEAVLDTGIEPDTGWEKKWLASHKAHPRYDHALLDGVMVPVDKKFPGGIPYPHAPGLPASQVINCGCTHVLTRKDWEDVPKQPALDIHPQAVYN